MKDEVKSSQGVRHLACLRFSFLDVMNTQGFVICPDFKLVLRSFHKVSPFFQCSDYG